MKHETYIAIIIGTYSVISLFGQDMTHKHKAHREGLSTKDREKEDVTDFSITMNVADSKCDS